MESAFSLLRTSWSSSNTSILCHVRPHRDATKPIIDPAMTDEAQYLLVRLILRKPEKWYRSDSLKTSYQKDIPNLANAMDNLCARSLNLPSQSNRRNPQTKKEPQYIVIDDSDEGSQNGILPTRSG